MFNRLKFTVAALAASALITGAAVYAAPALAVGETQHYELEDGTKIIIEGDLVSIVNEDGTTSPIPDGEYMTTDGKAIVAKDSMYTDTSSEETVE